MDPKMTHKTKLDKKDHCASFKALRIAQCVKKGNLPAKSFEFGLH